jgi:hypothetical protein
MELGIDHHSDRFKLGSNILFEVLFDFLDCGGDGGIHVFIDGGNICTDLSHFLLGFCQIRVQGIEASFQVLAKGMGHDEEGTRNGASGTTHKMGYGLSLSQRSGQRDESNGVKPK